MILSVPIPERLDRWTAPEKAQPEWARMLRYCNITDRPGALSRGKGRVRTTGLNGETVSVTACGLFVRRSNDTALIWAMTNGTIKIQVNESPLYADSAF